MVSESGSRLLTWLEGTGPAAWVRESIWAYPAVEAAHILGFTVLVGSAIMFDLRLLGFTRSLPVAAAARHLLRWSRLSLLVVAPTGLMLFMAQATQTWANPAFRLKLLLLAVAGLNALIFHLWTLKSVEMWEQRPTTPAGAKIAALISIIAWAGVITCGRLIAYV
ncbi:MAG: hypothetical protein LC672_05075 [Acidobacteria bacterium]|nr:hypothetical protein [Acidobacteriota bacterium]